MSKYEETFNSFYNDDDDIELTEEELALSDSLDKLGKRQNNFDSNHDKITKEMLEDLAREARHKKYLLSTDISEKAINERVPQLVAQYREGEARPVQVQMMGGSTNLEQLSFATGMECVQLLTGYDVMTFLQENDGVQYRTSAAMEAYLRENHPECFKERPENYINPAAISDPISREIMSLDIPVGKPKEVKRNLEAALGEDLERSDLDGVLYMNYFGEHEGHYRGVDNDIQFFLGITNETVQKGWATPDLIMICVPVDGSPEKIAWFNLKTGYNKKASAWKEDYGSITRKIKQILKVEEMTDFKMQDTRGKK